MNNKLKRISGVNKKVMYIHILMHARAQMHFTQTSGYKLFDKKNQLYSNSRFFCLALSCQSIADLFPITAVT